jgi:TalC/MipB family fructose-6-phosphate aldolase
MKIFLDTADVKSIKERFESGLIDGVTTNPTLIMKSGGDPVQTIKELVELGVPDISAEVVADTSEEMLEAAKEYIELGPQVTIKLPCTPEGLKACKELSANGIRVNVTLVFAVSQAILAAKAGATYISPFVGRVDDQRFGGLELIERICKLFREQMVTTQVLTASTRSVFDVEKSFTYGTDVVTMPVAIFDKMYGHILTKVGVEQFNKDWEKALENGN